MSLSRVTLPRSRLGRNTGSHDKTAQRLEPSAIAGDIVGEWRNRERRVDLFRATASPTARGCAAAYFPDANPRPADLAGNGHAA